MNAQSPHDDISNHNAQIRQEKEDAQSYVQLKGHIAKKILQLKLFPELVNVPDKAKELMSEATQCFIYDFDNACISLCRACLEDTLNNLVTGQIQDEIRDEREIFRRKGRNVGDLFAMIEVLSRHGMLGNHKSDAHAVRTAGNDILHKTSPRSAKSKLAKDILNKTRLIHIFIHENPQNGI